MTPAEWEGNGAQKGRNRILGLPRGVFWAVLGVGAFFAVLAVVALVVGLGFGIQGGGKVSRFDPFFIPLPFLYIPKSIS